MFFVIITWYYYLLRCFSELIVTLKSISEQTNAERVGQGPQYYGDFYSFFPTK